MIEVASKRPEDFIVPHQPETGQSIQWICMDERPTQNGEFGPYRQLAGGAHGIGQDLTIARATDVALHRGKRAMEDFIDRQEPVHRMGGIAAKILKAEGIMLNLHGRCAAEGAAELVARDVIANPDESTRAHLLETAKQLVPDFDEKRTEIGIAAYSYMSKKPGAYIPLEESTRAFAQGESGLYEPVNREELIGEHIAEQIIANHTSGTIYDSRAAWEARATAYHISFGDLEELRGPLADQLPVTAESFMAATALRHAGIFPKLPAGANGLFPVNNITQYRLAA